MNDFYVFDTVKRQVQRVVAFGNRMVVMSDGECLDDVSKLQDKIYIGEKGAYIQPDSFFKLLRAFETAPHTKMKDAIYNLGQALKRIEIRCDMDRNIYSCNFLLEEKDEDAWSLFIMSPSDATCYFLLVGVCEEFAKGVGREIIEAAIAAGVDLRANWEIKRLSSNPK